MKYLLAAVLILSPAMSLAAASDFNLNQIQVPQPIQDIYHTFSQIHIDLGQNQAVQGVGQGIQNTISDLGKNPQNWLLRVGNWWRDLNTWLQTHIGVSLTQILTAIGNLFVWVFELMIKLIKLALPGVQ